MAITTTIGGASTDSFITLVTWEAYVLANITQTPLGGHGHDDGHEMNIRRAGQWLNQMGWIGDKQYETQSMSWPRVTSKLVDGWSIDIDTIPQPIKDAQCELAYLIHEGADPWATVTSGAVKVSEVKAGPVSSKTEYANFRETPRYVGAMALIGPYLKAGAGQVRMYRG